MTIDWLNIISGIILGSAISSIGFWLKYSKRLDELSDSVKSFSKYGTNIPPSVCQYCHNEVVFNMVQQDLVQGKVRNIYKCPTCDHLTKQYF